MIMHARASHTIKSLLLHARGAGPTGRVFLFLFLIIYVRLRLPESLGNMTALRYIDLSWNNITGESCADIQWKQGGGLGRIHSSYDSTAARIASATPAVLHPLRICLIATVNLCLLTPACKHLPVNLCHLGRETARGVCIIRFAAPYCFLPSPINPTYLFSSIYPGTIPGSLCHRGRNSSIVFLFLGYNQLTGSLKVSQCGSLSFIDVTVRSSRDGVLLLVRISTHV